MRPVNYLSLALILFLLLPAAGLAVVNPHAPPATVTQPAEKAKKVKPKKKTPFLQRFLHKRLAKLIDKKLRRYQKKHGTPALIQCDTLVFRNGKEVIAKISEVSAEEIKYKKCDFPDGPTFTVSKSELVQIKYSNGDKESIIHSKTPASTSSPSGQVDNLARSAFLTTTLSFIIWIVGALIGSGLIALLGFLGVVSGMITGFRSLKRFKKDPTLKGDWMAYIAIGLGILGALLFLVGLIAVLSVL